MKRGPVKVPKGVVENAGLANQAGWQIRTLAQYLAEYKLTLKMAKK
jgi:hypothetical protein